VFFAVSRVLCSGEHDRIRKVPTVKDVMCDAQLIKGHLRKGSLLIRQIGVVGDHGQIKISMSSNIEGSQSNLDLENCKDQDRDDLDDSMVLDQCGPFRVQNRRERGNIHNDVAMGHRIRLKEEIKIIKRALDRHCKSAVLEEGRRVGENTESFRRRENCCRVRRVRVLGTRKGTPNSLRVRRKFGLMRR
jgi:hypothetical protein